MPKDYSEVVADVQAMAGELRRANEHIELLTAQLKDAGLEPVAAPPLWNPNLFKRVDELELSVRSQNRLQNAGIEHVYQLVVEAESELLKTTKLGRRCLDEIKEVFADLGLELGTKLPDNFPRVTQ